MKPRCRSVLAATLAALMILSVPAQAHNERVHSDMVELAYEIMRANAAGYLNIDPPSGANLNDWNAFMTEMKGAPAKFRATDGGLPFPPVQNCAAPIDGVTNVPGANWSQGPMGNIKHPIDPFYNRVAFDCGVRYNWTPGGIFDASNQADFSGKRDYTGTVLGYWAANVDAEVDDTHLWIKPQNALGAGAVKKFVNDATSFGIGVLLAPFICLGELFAGDPSACLADSMDAGNKANLVKDVDGALPGIGNISGLDWTGEWHFIKVMGAQTNDFDDHEGNFLEDAGPFASMDAVDIALMTGYDLSGISVNYDASNGPKRYESPGGDFSPATVHRGKVEWQISNIAHTSFEPVDNLGQFGWNNYRLDPSHSANSLGWPLHALGDVTVPMHVAGTSAWGHRPFEDAQDNLWPDLRMQKALPADQLNMVRDIVIQAFNWWLFVKNWRSAHPGDPTQAPVREMITQLATHTASYSAAQQQAISWPFNGGLSTGCLRGGDYKKGSIEFYQNFPNAAGVYRPVVEDGVGAMIAFLMSASEVL